MPQSLTVRPAAPQGTQSTELKERNYVLPSFQWNFPRQHTVFHWMLSKTDEKKD